MCERIAINIMVYEKKKLSRYVSKSTTQYKSRRKSVKCKRLNLRNSCNYIN